MLRSTRACVAAWAAATLLLGGCPRRDGPTERSFAPGEVARETDLFALELVSVFEDDRTVRARVGVTNRADRPLALAQEGILMQHEALEYPLSDPPEPDEHPIVIPPDQRRDLVLRFDLGRPMSADGTLLFRSATLGSTHVVGLQLPIPGLRSPLDSATKPEKR